MNKTTAPPAPASVFFRLFLRVQAAAASAPGKIFQGVNASASAAVRGLRPRRHDTNCVAMLQFGYAWRGRPGPFGGAGRHLLAAICRHAITLA
jgi:hypothetical protein